MRKAVGLSIVLLVLGAVMLLFPRQPEPPAGIDPARIRVACQQYAGLDLSGLASICRDAGYQETLYSQPTGAPVFWPQIRRVIQPEDLDQ